MTDNKESEMKTDIPSELGVLISIYRGVENVFRSPDLETRLAVGELENLMSGFERFRSKHSDIVDKYKSKLGIIYLLLDLKAADYLLSHAYNNIRENGPNQQSVYDILSQVNEKYFNYSQLFKRMKGEPIKVSENGEQKKQLTPKDISERLEFVYQLLNYMRGELDKLPPNLYGAWHYTSKIAVTPPTQTNADEKR